MKQFDFEKINNFKEHCGNAKIYEFVDAPYYTCTININHGNMRKSTFVLEHKGRTLTFVDEVIDSRIRDLHHVIEYMIASCPEQCVQNNVPNSINFNFYYITSDNVFYKEYISKWNTVDCKSSLVLAWDGMLKNHRNVLINMNFFDFIINVMNVNLLDVSKNTGCVFDILKDCHDGFDFDNKEINKTGFLLNEDIKKYRGLIFRGISNTKNDFIMYKSEKDKHEDPDREQMEKLIILIKTFLDNVNIYDYFDDVSIGSIKSYMSIACKLFNDFIKEYTEHTDTTNTLKESFTIKGLSIPRLNNKISCDILREIDVKTCDIITNDELYAKIFAVFIYNILKKKKHEYCICLDKEFCESWNKYVDIFSAPFIQHFRK